MRWAALVLLLILIGFSQKIAHAQMTTSAITVEMALSETATVVGQPIVISIRAVDPSRTEGLQLLPPALSQFGQTAPSDVTVKPQVVDGLAAIVYEQQVTIYPNHVGTFIIPPARVLIPETPLSPQQVVQSPSRVVTIVPLPQPMPQEFINAVGTFEVEMNVDRLSIEAQEALTLTLKIRGEGNFPLLLPPRLQNTGDWRIFPPQRLVKSAQELWFQWILTPRRSGLLELPQLTFAWYDPRQQRYKSAELESPSIAVGAGLPQPVLTSEPLPEVAVEYSVNVNHAWDLTATRPNVWPDPIFWAIPLMLSGGALLLSAVKRTPTNRRRRAPAQVDLRSELQTALRLPPIQAFPMLEAIFRKGLARYHADEDLQIWLASLPEPLQHRIRTLLHTLIDARFAPASSEDVRIHAQAILRMLQQLEKTVEHE